MKKIFLYFGITLMLFSLFFSTSLSRPFGLIGILTGIAFMYYSKNNAEKKSFIQSIKEIIPYILFSFLFYGIVWILLNYFYKK